MQVDAYQYCPCGSGKKIKFCKCADNFKDLDKIDRMISGGQLVAALDRINQLLQTNASAAWLLALKAQILFQLREFEALSETANRFWKLKPDNQLALWLMTICETVREPSIQVAAKYFLDGVGEVRDVIHPFGQTAGLMLAERLAMEGNYLSAVLITDLLVVLFKSEAPAEFMDELTKESGVSALLRITPTLCEQEGVLGGNERLQEVRALFRSHRLQPAYAKLQSLNREFADQPILLSMLVIIELYRCDAAAAARYCERLSRNEMLSTPERIYYQALAFALAPSQSGITYSPQGLLFELTAEQEEHCNHLLKQLHSIEVVESEADSELRQSCAGFIGEEIGPRDIYQFFASCKVTLDGECVEVESSRGLIAMFGKQTDHPARLLVRYTEESTQNALVVDEILSALGLSRDKSVYKAPAELLPVPIQSLFQVYLRGGNKIDPSSEEQVAGYRRKLKATVRERIKTVPLSCLDGKMAAEVAGSTQYQWKLSGLLLHLLAFEDGAFTAKDYELLSAELQLPAPPRVVVDASLSNLSPADLYFVDIAQLAPKAVLPVGSYFMEMKLVSRFPALLERLEKSDIPDEPPGMADEMRLMLRFSAAEFLSERLDAAEKLIAKFAEANKPVGQLIMSAVNLLFHAGRAEEGQALFSKYAQKYPRDPVLLAVVQQLMSNIPASQQPLSPTLPLGSTQESEGGLWIPGNAEPSSSDASSGGSKLWLPGME